MVDFEVGQQYHKTDCNYKEHWNKMLQKMSESH